MNARHEELLSLVKVGKQRLSELHRGKKFHAKQLAVFNTIFKHNKKRVFIRKGRKGGGTECALYIAARIAGTMPNKAVYIIGPTQVQQCEIMWSNHRIQNFIPREWNIEINEKEKRIRLPNKSYIKIEGANNPEAARGWEGDAFIWDERKDHDELSLTNAFPNVLARNALWVELGTPPTKKDTGYYKREQEIKNDPDWAFFKWSSWDNPFNPGGHAALRKEKEKYFARGEEWIWITEYEAEYCFTSARKVLPSFDPDKVCVPLHVIDAEIDPDRKHMDWYYSVDPGYASCFAVLFVGVNRYTGRIYIVDELYITDRNKCSVWEVWPEIERRQKQHFKGIWTELYDSAATSFSVESEAYFKKEKSVHALVPTNKQQGDEDEYFRAINASYADERVQVADHCHGYITEADNYETDDKNNYPDKNNHQLDNNRYIYKFAGITKDYSPPKIVVTSDRRKAYTLEDDLREQAVSNGFVGYGGEDADFDLTKIMM